MREDVAVISAAVAGATASRLEPVSRTVDACSRWREVYVQEGSPRRGGMPGPMSGPGRTMMRAAQRQEGSTHPRRQDRREGSDVARGGLSSTLPVLTRLSELSG